mmetsp:Transcript_52503/g.109576  ORF Transcript_52503/g.109576 Transcript_52503/m.109576 type:complete len:336 (-) Transcript_52503:1892-2899(-)
MVCFPTFLGPRASIKHRPAPSGQQWACHGPEHRTARGPVQGQKSDPDLRHKRSQHPLGPVPILLLLRVPMLRGQLHVRRPDDGHGLLAMDIPALPGQRDRGRPLQRHLPNRRVQRLGHARVRRRPGLPAGRRLHVHRARLHRPLQRGLPLGFELRAGGDGRGALAPDGGAGPRRHRPHLPRGALLPHLRRRRRRRRAHPRRVRRVALPGRRLRAARPQRRRRRDLCGAQVLCGRAVVAGRRPCTSPAGDVGRGPHARAVELRGPAARLRHLRLARQQRGGGGDGGAAARLLLLRGAVPLRAAGRAAVPGPGLAVPLDAHLPDRGVHAPGRAVGRP